MQPRMTHPVFMIPGALQALQAIGKATELTGAPGRASALAELRVGQINGCGVCVDMHGHQLKTAGETDERIIAVSAWRDAPYYSDAERAALALAESITRLSDRSDPVPDAVWNQAQAHFPEPQLAALLLRISLLNFWTRLNVSTRQVASEWRKSAAQRDAVEAAAR